MLGRRTGALVVALAVLPLASCGPDSQTDLYVKIECNEEMFLSVHVVEDGLIPEAPGIDFDDAPYAVPFLNESVGRFDLNAEPVDLYVVRVTHPYRFTGPFRITPDDLVPLHPGPDEPKSLFIVPEDQCPTADDPPR